MMRWKWLAVCSMLLVAGLAVVHLVDTPDVAAQVRAALVRSVDEPARVPYFHSAAPTCPFLNQCYAVFPSVPAGKRLHLTSVRVACFGTTATGFLFVNQNASTMAPLAAFTVEPAIGAFYGSMWATNQTVDLYFEAGEFPALEIGVPAGSGGIPASVLNKLTVSGYMVDILP